MRGIFEDKLIRVVKAVIIDGKSISDSQEILGEMSEGEINKLRSFANSHQLGHVVDYVLYSESPSERSLDFYTSAAVTMQQSRAAEDISRAFSSAEIKHMLLKGTLLRRLYPDEWMRNSCDVDVLVSREDLDRAGAILIEMGYGQIGDMSVHDVAYELECVRVELHYTLIEDYRMPAVSNILENAWDNINTNDSDSYAVSMTNELFYFYHIAHMAKHFGDGGCGMRSLVDLWILNNKCYFDRVRRDELLSEGGVLAFEKKMRKLSEYWFGDGDGEGLDFIEWYVLAGGAYGTPQMAEEVRVRRVGKVKYLFDRLFLPYSQLSRKYPSLKGRPVLTPIYEVRRWCEALFGNRKKYIGELKDTEHKSELENMIEELGLQKFR